MCQIVAVQRNRKLLSSALHELLGCGPLPGNVHLAYLLSGKLCLNLERLLPPPELVILDALEDKQTEHSKGHEQQYADKPHQLPFQSDPHHFTSMSL